MAFSGWRDYARQKRAKNDLQNLELAQSAVSITAAAQVITPSLPAHTPAPTNCSQPAKSPSQSPQPPKYVHLSPSAFITRSRPPPAGGSPTSTAPGVPAPTRTHRGTPSPYVLGSPTARQSTARPAFAQTEQPGITAQEYPTMAMSDLVKLASAAATSNTTDTKAKQTSGARLQPIFHRMVFYIDGWSGSAEFSFQEIKEIAVRNGAVLRDRDYGEVTHVIATNLTDTKMMKIKKPVVHPKWIIECNAQKSLLPWTRYRAFTAHGTSQKSLAEALQKSIKSGSVSVAVSSSSSSAILPSCGLSNTTMAPSNPSRSNLSVTLSVSGMAGVQDQLSNSEKPQFLSSDTKATPVSTNPPHLQPSMGAPSSAAQQHLDFSGSRKRPPEEPIELNTNRKRARDTTNDQSSIRPAPAPLVSASASLTSQNFVAQRDSGPGVKGKVTSGSVDESSEKERAVDLETVREHENREVERDKGKGKEKEIKDVAPDGADEDGGEDEAEDEEESWWGPRRPQVDMQGQWVKENISTAPGFLNKFYQSSRLHYLSTWKGDLQKWVKEQSPQIPRVTFASIYPPTANTASSSLSKIQSNTSRTIMHIDLDCFFASVSIMKHPHAAEIRAKPVAVAHSAGTNGASTSEIASCNYAARDFGIRNGMSIGRARVLCPDLIVVPYEFELYMATSKTFFSILLKYADALEVVSCDEAYVDMTKQITRPGIGMEMAIAQHIRSEIRQESGVAASIGIAENLLLARMATKQAKPDGAFHMMFSAGSVEVMEMLSDQPISVLPGVGWSLTSKLEKAGVHNCGDLSRWSLSQLQRDHGAKVGKTLYDACRGIDQRLVNSNPVRRSVSADVNWGIRFETAEQVHKFLEELAGEVSTRLAKAEVRGKQITVKCKKKRYDGEPHKVLGCGDCDNLSRSITIAYATDDRKAIYTHSLALLKELNVEATELRGIGIMMTRLTEEKGGREKTSMQMKDLKTHFASISEKHEKCTAQQQQLSGSEPQSASLDGAVKRKRMIEEDDSDDMEVVNQRAVPARVTAAPPAAIYNPSEFLPPTASQVDQEVLALLPESIRKEISNQWKAPAVGTTSSNAPAPRLNRSVAGNKRKTQQRHPPQRTVQPPPPSFRAPNNVKDKGKNQQPQYDANALDDVLPSASQVDPNILAALPENIRRELDDAWRRKAGGHYVDNIERAHPAVAPAPANARDKGKQPAHSALTSSTHMVIQKQNDMPVKVVRTTVIPEWIRTALEGERRAPMQDEVDRMRRYVLGLVEDAVDEARLVIVGLRREVQKGLKNCRVADADSGGLEEEWMGMVERLKGEVVSCVEGIYGLPVKQSLW